MIHSKRFTAVLDTNVIFPIEVRDLLFWFAHHDLYTPKWSQHIFSEWEDVMRRREVAEAEIAKRLARVAAAFPDAMVKNYEPLIDTLDLPDQKDRHVLAAAIKVNANVIVTNNLKDFPEDYLKRFGLSVKSADEFLAETIDLAPNRAVEAFRELVLYRRNPDQDEYEVLQALRRNGLVDTANYLHALL
ncbi:PIN domain-containing protein [Neolewinella litorea]|uniref:PIN domain-containing protein n=1 Tax=Neolewinella litorea TaxID=2562452 RepID=A0A4V3XJW0_9BACT|nr:PIN domain-containing protein [Neolewinella litorea]THH34593.1 PIN domain-containing protein [Neolewinella litorea]